MTTLLMLCVVLVAQPAGTPPPDTPDTPEALTPRACLVRAGELLEADERDEALELYRRADLRATDPDLRSAARYNLAMALYRGATGQVPSAA